MSWFQNNDGDIMCNYQVPTNKRLLAVRARQQGTLVLNPNFAAVATSPKPSPVAVIAPPKQRRLNSIFADAPAKNLDAVESFADVQETTLSENETIVTEEDRFQPDPELMQGLSVSEPESTTKPSVAVETHNATIDQGPSTKDSSSKKHPSSKKHSSSKKHPSSKSESSKIIREGMNPEQQYISESYELEDGMSYTKLVQVCPDDFSVATNCAFGYVPSTLFGENVVSLEVQHPYKLYVSDNIEDGALYSAIDKLEDIMNEAIILDLQDSCGDDRRRALELIPKFQDHQRRRLSTFFSSIEKNPSDSKTEESCVVEYSEKNTTNCVNIDANSTATYSSMTEFASESEITLRIQKVIQKGCEDGSFVDTLLPDSGVDKCVFISTKTGVIGGRADPVNLNQVEDSEKIDINRMTGVGVAFVALLVGGVILIALMAARRQKEITAKEFVEMEEGDVHKDDLVGKYGLDLSEDASTSLDSAAIPPQLVQFVDNGDDESRLSSPDHDQNAFANGGRYNPHGTNVHNCTSAMCDICAATEGHRLNPTFIGTYDMYTAQHDTEAAVVDDIVEF
jgi:hypothetical protein